MKEKKLKKRCGLILSAMLMLFTPFGLQPGAEEMVEESFGQEFLLFEDIGSVFAASKYEQKVTDAPSSISIITADDIRKYGYRSFADILSSVRGIYVTNDRNYRYVGVRGVGIPGDYNSRVLLLIDGHRTNDRIYDMAYLGTSFILDPDIIDRIEVVRGPSSSIYGRSALLAVINVITRSGRELKGLEASGNYGTFKSGGGRLTYGRRLAGGTEFILSGSFFDSQGDDLYFPEFDDPATNNGVAEGGDDDASKSLFAKVTLNKLTIEGAFVEREKGIPTAPWGIDFNDAGNRTWDSSGFLNLKYEDRLRNNLTLTARLFYDWFWYEGDYIWTWDADGDLIDDRVVNKDVAKATSYGGSLGFAGEMVKGHMLNLGLEYEKSGKQEQANNDEAPYYWSYSDVESTAENYALYLQDEFSFSDNIILNAGLRYDHYDSFGGKTSPRVALIYSPSQKSSLKFLYGQAFRAPNAYELHYNDGGSSQKANHDLEPETMNSAEVIYEHMLGSGLRANASVFRNRFEDLIEQQLDPADSLLVFNNGGDMESKGIEVEIEKRWAGGMDGRISYTRQDSKNLDNGESLPNSPEHLLKINLSAPLLGEKLILNSEAQYMSKRETLGASESKAFTIINLTLLSRNLTKGLDLSLSVYNLLDKEYTHPGAGEHLQTWSGIPMETIEQDGRTYRFKATYRF